MKKFMLVFVCLCLCFLAVGCENETKIRTAHISDITGAMSTKYAVKVVLDDDDRVSDKYVDLQLKSDKEEQILKVAEENGEFFTICLPKKDYWYNLTYLISKSNGTPIDANFTVYEDYGNKVFNFTSQNDFNLTLRVVAGQSKKNGETQENILVLSEDISEEVAIKVKKMQE